MAYWEWGDPDNDKVLLCIHSLMRNGRDFDTLAHEFKSEYRVVCPDLVGRGASEYLNDPMFYELPQYVADMVTLLARLKARQLDFIGSGMGGQIGISLGGWSALQIESFQEIANVNVYRLPEHEFLFGKMILNDVGPSLDYLHKDDMIDKVSPVTYDNLDHAVNQVKLKYDSWGPLSPVEWREFTKAGLYELDGQWHDNFDPNLKESLINFDQKTLDENTVRLWNAYIHISCPILIMRAQHSSALTEKTARRMVSQNANAKLVTLVDQGHMPTLMPENQLKILRDFLID